MVHEITLTRAYIRIGDGLMDSQRLGFEPLSVLIVEALLGYLADIDFRVKISGKSLVMVASIAVYDIQVMDFVKIVLSGIGSIDAAYARVKTTTQNSGKSGFLELVLISPLPAILEVSLVLRFVVGGVQIVAATGQTGIHDGEVLIRQGQVDNQLGLEAIEEHLELLYIIGIHLGGLNIWVAYRLDYLVAFLLTATGYHKVGKHIGILVNLECRYGGDASGANHQYSAHFCLFYFI